MSQKELLQSLLNKKLGVQLINIETKTNEQMRVLAYTSEHYLYLNQSIDRLKKGYQDYCESKNKEKNKQKKTAKEKPIKRPSYLTRSKTEMSIYNPKKELQPIASSDNYLRRHLTSSTFKKTNNQLSKSMNVKAFSSTFKKGYKVSKVKETPINQSTRLKKRNNTDSNRKSSNVKGLSERSGTLTSFYPKQQRKAQCEILNEEFLIENDYKAIAKEHETTFMTKRMKPPEEYKEELITIQQQIIKVSNSIVNTEKAMGFKRSSLLSPFITDKGNECYFNSNSDKKWLLNILGYLPLKDKLNLYSTSKTFKKLLTKKLTQLKNRIENALNITNSNLSSINDQILGLSKVSSNIVSLPNCILIEIQV